MFMTLSNQSPLERMENGVSVWAKEWKAQNWRLLLWGFKAEYGCPTTQGPLGLSDPGHISQPEQRAKKWDCGLIPTSQRWCWRCCPCKVFYFLLPADAKGVFISISAQEGQISQTQHVERLQPTGINVGWITQCLLRQNCLFPLLHL